MPTHFSFKPGCAIHPFHGASEGNEYMIETQDARRFRISGTTLRLIEQLNEGTSLEDLCAGYGNITCDDLRAFILANYGDFLRYASGESFVNQTLRPPAAAKSTLLVAWTIVSPSVTRAVSSCLSFLYSPVVAGVLLVLILAAHLFVYFPHGLAPARLVGAHVSVILALCIASILAHELGHASALTRYGGTPSGIGFGLYILLPVFYADVSEAWSLRRWQRVIVDLGGVYFQQVFFLFAALLAAMFGNPSFGAVCAAIDIMTFIALNPALRFDGYWVIADWLGLTGLHRSAALYVRGLIASITGRRPPAGHYPQHLSRAKTAVFVCYALLSNLFLLFLIALNLQWVHSAALALLSGLPGLGHELLQAMTGRQWMRSADLAVTCVFLFASGTTVLLGIFFQTRTIVQVLRRKYFTANAARSHSLGANL